MGNKQGAIDYWVKMVEKILPGGGNGALLRTQFEAMSDKEFEEIITAIEEDRFIIPLYSANLDKPTLSTERNLKIAEEIGHTFFEHLILTDPSTGMLFKTPRKYLIILLPLRKQRQMLRDKVTIPEDNKHVDDLTGQATGPSKGSSLSYPEFQILYGKGLYAVPKELMKFRGGDEKAFNQMNKQIIEQGGYSQAEGDKLGTRAKATDTLSTLLTAAHIRNNA